MRAELFEGAGANPVKLFSRFSHNKGYGRGKEGGGRRRQALNSIKL